MNFFFKYLKKIGRKAAKMPKKCKITFKKTFFQGKFMAKLSIFFQYSESSFSKQFCHNFFMFSVLSSKMEQNKKKKLLKTEHQCTTSVKLPFKNCFLK